MRIAKTKCTCTMIMREETSGTENEWFHSSVECCGTSLCSNTLSQTQLVCLQCTDRLLHSMHVAGI